MLDDHSLKVVKAQYSGGELHLETTFLGENTSKYYEYEGVGLEPSENSREVHGLATIDFESLQRVARASPILNDRFMAFAKRYDVKPAQFTSRSWLEPGDGQSARKQCPEKTASSQAYRPGLQLLCEAQVEY